MSKPRLLDLFCGAGGAAVGYHRVGFEVVGVDNRPMPRYPFEFHQADALEYVAEHGQEFDAIHASPPCQVWTVYRNARPNSSPRWPDLIEPTRRDLLSQGRPYVIENVPRSPLLNPVRLCGTSFGLRIRRHRLFETNWLLLGLPCDHGRFTERLFPGSTNRPHGRTVCNIGEYRVPLARQLEEMQLSDMTLSELSQAIPPAYTEWIGRQLLEALRG